MKFKGVIQAMEARIVEEQGMESFVERTGGVVSIEKMP